MKMNKRAMALVTLSIIIAGGIGITAVAATGNRAANIKSKGVFDFENGSVVIDASDLTYLADEIDTLEDTYKQKTTGGLNSIGTYYDANGEITYDEMQSAITPELASNLTFDQLFNGIVNSQKIYNAGDIFTDVNGTQYYKLPNGSITTNSAEEGAEEVVISEATADNLSAGTAAWVDGKLIVGTGADNNSYFLLGYAEGLAKSENAKIKFTRHNHTGSSTSGGGCYGTKKQIMAPCGGTYTYDVPGSQTWGCTKCGAIGRDRFKFCVNSKN